MNLDSIDTQKLGHHLVRRRRKLDVALRDIGAATGISASTLSRIERNTGKLDADHLATICTWLNMPIAAFVRTTGPKVIHRGGADLTEMIEAVLNADPTLDQRAKDTLADLMAAAIAHSRKP